MESVTFSVSDMHCDGCVRRVTEVLKGLPGVGVERVEVGRAVVSFAGENTSSADVVEALTTAGYAATVTGGSEAVARSSSRTAGKPGCCGAG